MAVIGILEYLRLWFVQPIRSGEHGIPVPRWWCWFGNMLHVTARILYWVAWFLVGFCIVGGSVIFFLRVTEFM